MLSVLYMGMIMLTCFDSICISLFCGVFFITSSLPVEIKFCEVAP